jgi:hypothetical protein
MIAILRSLLRERWQRLMLRPFWRLTAHFGQRLFTGSDDAGEGELSLGIGAILALLATPGMFITVFLFDKYSSLLRFIRGNRPFYDQSLPDQYFFFAFSMAVTGVVTALKWDSIFPGRQDYMNLAPLPVRTRNIFLANIIAIVMVTLFFAVDVNAVSALLFPYLVNMEQSSFHDYLRFTGIHVLGVLLSSLFIFFALFAVIGSLMSILPNQVFRNLSLYLRVGVVIAMLTLLYTTFAVPELLRDSIHSHSRILLWLPPVWFLGLARSLVGKASPQLVHLGAFGLRMMAAAMAAATVSYVVSYYRYFIRIPENLDVAIRKREPRRLLPPWLLDSVLLRSPFERACYRFTLKTLQRNEQQSMILGGFVGLGLVLASQTLGDAFRHKAAAGVALPSQEFLSLPLILAFFVICGLRFVFELPAELRANWAARVIVNEQKHQAVAVARKVMLSLVWPWLLLVALPLYVWYAGWMVALGHMAVVMTWSYCLADFLLRRFRKIAFTCAYAPWKQNATVMVLLYAMGAYVFTAGTAGLEHGLLVKHPGYLWVMAVAGLAAWKLFAKMRQDELDPTGLIFEDAPSQALELLNLTRN